MIRIELSHVEIAWTDENVGRKRHVEATELSWIPRNTSAERNLTDHILGARCEAAAYKWAKPVKWTLYAHGEKLPDLHDFIDVKGVPKPTYNLVVTERDPNGWAYLLVDGSNHPFYDIVSWCWGFEAKTNLPEMRSPKQVAAHHYVDREDSMLKNPELLLLVLRERQEFPERANALAAMPR